jgi:hypothetical protein
MARTLIPTAQLNLGLLAALSWVGSSPATVPSDVANGMYFVNRPGTFLVVRANDAAAHGVNIITGGTLKSLPIDDVAGITTAGVNATIFGPFDPKVFDQPNTLGIVNVDPGLSCDFLCIQMV